MKAEQARKLADDALTNLSAALAGGQSDTLKQYLAAMSRFHDYSWGNVLLIVMQKPDATRVAGFQTWRKLGRFVRKGEKGIAIIAPMRIANKDETADQPSDEERTILRFKAVHVFDVSQTEGDPLPEFAVVTGDPQDHTDRLKALIAAKGIALAYSDNLGGAKGRSCQGKIDILTGQSPAEEFAVLTHELAHEMMHTRERRQESTKTVRETEAEAVAYVVCAAIGLTSGTASVDYIKLYNGNAETLAESLEAIQQTAAEIIAHLLRKEPVVS